MFLLPFHKKKEEVKKVYVPVDLVMSYSSQGLSEDEIKNQLHSQGFTSDVVDKALRIALKEKVTSQMPEVVPPQQRVHVPQPQTPHWRLSVSVLVEAPIASLAHA